ncbi:MAG TPA: hypothetical protein VD927_12255 [Chryseosolibacter sp.]|nr:hypothetical protein [Chryseosolibacter sp.]
MDNINWEILKKLKSSMKLDNIRLVERGQAFKDLNTGYKFELTINRRGKWGIFPMKEIPTAMNDFKLKSYEEYIRGLCDRIEELYQHRIPTKY